MCCAVFDKLKKEKGDGNSRSGADSDADPMPFQGDTFRNAEDYAFDVFRQTMHDNLPSEVPEDEDDDKEELEMANMVAELEKSWEPPRQGAPCQEAINVEVDDENDDDEGAPCQTVTVDNLDVVDEGHTQG